MNETKIDKIVVGVDLGSVTAKTVLMNQDMEILDSNYQRHKGHPGTVLLKVLKDMFTRFPISKVEAIGITGSGGKRIAKILQAGFCNEVIAETLAVSRYYPEVYSIINIGGQDSKLIHLNRVDGKDFIIENFSMNSLCAAGTGAFLDQQANRLGVKIEGEFGEMALKSENPPRIAGRCSVFAKSDMIHLQQKGTPLHDIVAGLCFAMARNFKATIGKNAEIKKNVAFIGGVARNLGMVRAFREVLHLNEDELIIPEHNSLIGAIGAALNVFETKTPALDLVDVEEKLKAIQDKEEGFAPLKIRDEHLISKQQTIMIRNNDEKIKAFLGIDIGSISTNIVLVDEDKRLIAKEYLRTGSQPIEAVKRGLREIGRDMGDSVEILGACTTGSARYLIGDFIGADMVKDEITAHARGSREVDPEVDTIFEIGGQDSKYLSLENGTIVDFEMNKVCAAGTGSFLEEQAERLGIGIEDQFSDFALCAKDPSRCGERCTVFMESDLVHHQQKGVPKEDIVAGLAYSIVYNYINKVVEGRRIGNHIFLQGGVAFNKAVVAAFETVLEKDITVPPNHEVMGAYGAALIAADNVPASSQFKGWDAADQEYTLKTFECQSCANNCLINKTVLGDGTAFFYGSRCDKYDKQADKTADANADFPDYYKYREMLLHSNDSEEAAVKKPVARIGIPYSMTVYEDFPLWKTFFTQLGCEVVLSLPTNKKHISRGVESVVEETCFPIKVLHGHVLELTERNVDYIWLPYFMDMWNDNPRLKEKLLCPYVQGAPDIIRTAFNPEDKGVKMLSPIVKPSVGHKFQVDELHKVLGENMGFSKSRISAALKEGMKSLDVFRKSMVQKGEEIISEMKEDEFAIVVISRPYNGPDRGINLDIPAKLKSLGVKAIPMDFLPLHSVDIQEELSNMYWWFGHRALSASLLIKDNPKLFPVFINNFACGPDSFSLQYFLHLMGDKPNLILEIDEHSADAGIMTRLEAFVDSISNLPSRSGFNTQKLVKGPVASQVGKSLKSGKKTLYIPKFNDYIPALCATFRANGVNAQELPPTDEESLFYARKYTNNKECYPYILITGDIVKKVNQPDFKPDESVFLMPAGNGVCRLNLYESMQRIVLDKLGAKGAEIYAPTAEKAMVDTGKVSPLLPLDMWTTITASDCLFRAYRQTRPYETTKGQTDMVYKSILSKFNETLENRGNITKFMEYARTQFDTINVDKSVNKPKIGIIGEFYVRWQTFSNNNFFDLVEQLGGEVVPAPVSENMMHFNHVVLGDTKRKKKMGEWLKMYLSDSWQHYQEHRIYKPFEGFLDIYPDPDVQYLEDLAKPYANEIIENEIVISLGKSRWLLENKYAQGIVNLIPFTCLLGTTIAAMLKSLKDDYPNSAIATFKFDGAADVNILTRLEAYMHQAQQYLPEGINESAV